MPGFLKQSTAAQSRAIGPFVDSTDYQTAETGLTIANTDIKLVVNGGASANKNSGGGTHRVNGIYGITFDATDTATVGEIEISVVVAGALPVFDKFFVLEETVYDALFNASAPGYFQPTTAGRTLDVSATGEAGLVLANIGSPTTAVNLSATNIDVDQVVASVSGAVGSVTGNVGGNVTGSVGTVNALAANVITAAATAADFTTEIQTGLATAANLSTLQTTANDILIDTGTTLPATLATIAGYIDTEIGTLQTSVNDLPTNGELTTALSGLATAASISALNNISAAQVNAEMVDVLATDTYAEPTGVPAATASLATKLGRIHQVLRNKLEVTATDKTLYDDAGAALWKKALSDDGTTYTEGEGEAP